jgi:hypothetical protein
MMLSASIFHNISWIIVIIHEECRRFHLMNQPVAAARRCDRRFCSPNVAVDQ